MSDKQKKIIVVDDNPENLAALRNTLKDLYEVYPSPSAAKMFNFLEHIDPPDLILLDVEMPEMNGYEAITKLKSGTQYKDIPVIFLTSMTDAKSEIEGLRLGAVDYIRKPFVTPLLLQRIKTYLALMDQQNEILQLLDLKTKAEMEAQESSRAKSEFLSNMSHEIRSPLNAVIGMINIATEETEMETVKHYLAKAGNASKFLMGVINDILDMSKIEANKFELSYDEFDFGTMVTNVMDIINVRAKEKSQNVTVNVSKEIPASLIGDELRLSQVVTNLLTNAIKFTPENGKIDLTAEKSEEADNEVTLKITVTDSGIGISPEQQKNLFTSFNQADSSITKKFGGTGLGLAISKRIVELMNGAIRIESELGKGAKFIFTIKAKKGTQTAAKAAATGTKAADFDFKKYTILVAEDMEFNREIIGKYLVKTGITLDFAEDGKIALSTFTQNPDKYDLIFMDIQMPEMNGYDVVRAIRALNLPHAKDIPIVAMTANAFQEDIEKSLEAGMNGHLAKPIVPKKVYAALQKYLPEKA
jgi:signal transduction histidine kinase